MKYPPREGDLPREELVKAAQKVKEESLVPVQVFFKFSCEHCGHRCMFQEPDKLFEKGECSECGQETVITHGGYALFYHPHKLREQRNN